MKITEDDVMKVIEVAGASGISRRDLAKKIGVDPSYRAEQLVRARLVTRSTVGREVVYIAVPKVSKVSKVSKVQNAPALAGPNLLKSEPKLIPEVNAGLLVATQEPGDGVRGGVPPGTSYGRVGLDKLIDEFVASLADRVTDRLRHILVDRLSISVAAMTAEIVENVPTPKEKPKLPSIFIGGLHSDQVHMIKKEFEGVADLRFANSDEHESLWKSRAAKANHTVLMVDFLSHKHVEAVNSVGVEAIVIRGGMTKLRDKLMELSV